MFETRPWAHLVADIRGEGEEDVRPSVDLIFLDDLVDHPPRVLPKQDEQGDQDQQPDQVGRQVLRNPAVSVLKE